ncbi:MAG: hypothetical protein H7144_05415 [Burkholderiales bacterium]|nr:hypothetical protein [Phycisphaerae bacterium]
MTTSLNARFDGKVFVPEGPVDVPAGQTVRLSLVPLSSENGATAEQLRDLLSRHAVDPAAMKIIEDRVADDCERIERDGW